MTRINRILVPTDFSEAADDALDYALDLAPALGATVSLVHVLADPYEGKVYSEQYPPMPEEIRAVFLADARERLAHRVARGGGSGVTSTMVTGPTAQAIVASARVQKADLIVMGTHGRHGVAHFLMGSVAERVVRIAPCPVLTVRGASMGGDQNRAVTRGTHTGLQPA